MRAAVIGQGAVGLFLSARLGVAPLTHGELPAATDQVVFLAVPDRAIAALAEQLRAQGDWALVHCSGASALASLGEGASAVWHPMRAMPRGASALQSLGGAVVGLRGDASLVTWLELETTRWGGVPVRVEEAQAVRVHAACCFAAGLTASVAAHGYGLLRDAGLSPEQARRAAQQLSESAIDQALSGGGLTGPAVRGDRATIEAHLEVLGPLEALYRSLSLSLSDHEPLSDEIRSLLEASTTP